MARLQQANSYDQLLVAKKIQALNGSRGGSGAGEAEVVDATQLSVVLKVWRDRWNIERGQYQYGVNMDPSQRTMGPVEWLAQETKLPRDTVRNAMRKTQQTIGFTIAEKLLMAIDREYMLANGQIEVMPNPFWSQERWFNYMRERGCV